MPLPRTGCRHCSGRGWVRSASSKQVGGQNSVLPTCKLPDTPYEYCSVCKGFAHLPVVDEAGRTIEGVTARIRVRLPAFTLAPPLPKPRKI